MSYELGKLDKEGQRINIRIELFRSFQGGWLSQMEKTRLITPYGGK